MSSLYQKNGRWYVQWYEDGKRHQKALIPPGFRRATTTKSVAKLLQRRLDAQNCDQDDKHTLPDLLDEYKSVAILRGSEEQSGRIKKVINDYLTTTGIQEVSGITKQSIQRWLSNLNLSQKTKKNKLSAITSFCRWLAEIDLMDSVPTVQVGKVKQLPPRHFTAKQRESVLQIAKDTGVFLEVFIPLYTGVRLAELRLMKWSDFSWGRKLLTVPDSKSKKWRSVPLSQLVIDTLQPIAGNGLVFPGAKKPNQKTSGYTAKHTFLSRIRPIQEAIPEAFTDNMAVRAVGRGYHLFRHDFAVRAAKAGVPIPELQNWLGHSSITTTMIYAKYSPDQYSDHIEKITF